MRIIKITLGCVIWFGIILLVLLTPPAKSEPFLITTDFIEEMNGRLNEHCLESPDQCRAKPVNLQDLSLQSVLIAQEVNKKINDEITYLGDYENYGREKFTITKNKRGDCEDYALRKKQLLIERGFNPSEMLLAIVNSNMALNNELHAVLMIRFKNAWIILDNRFEQPIDLRYSQYHFLLVQSPNEPKKFVLYQSESVR